MSKLNSQADKAEMGQGVADLSESYRITKLESIVSDLYKMLQVMNDRISHNSAGVELMAGSSGDDDDAGGYTDEFEIRGNTGADDSTDNDGDLSSLLEQINELDSSTNNGIRELLSIAGQAEALRFQGDYRFDEIVLQIWDAACDAGFNMYHDYLFVSITKAMLNRIE